jgi:hypothetical protein
MLERRPELAAALYEDVWRSRFGEEDEGDSLGYRLPVWGVRDGKFTSHYSRTFVEAGQRRPEAPRVSAAQWEALDMLSDLADELSFEMSFAPGDIQFVNNHVIYHARSEFADDAGSGRDRLLLRLWMAMPNSRAAAGGARSAVGRHRGRRAPRRHRPDRERAATVAISCYWPGMAGRPCPAGTVNPP